VSVRFITFGRATKETGELLQALAPLMPALGDDGTPVPPDLAEVARQAQHVGLVALRGEKLIAGSRLGVVGPALREQMMQLLDPALTEEMSWLEAEAVPLLERIWTETDRTQAWSEVVHTVLAGLCLDLGLRGAVLQARILEHLPAEYYVVAFVGGTGAENAYGVKMWRNKGEEMGVGHLWHRHVPRASTFNPEDVQALHAIVTQSENAGADLSQASLLRLQFFGLIARDALCPAVPVVRYESGDALMEAVETVSHHCVNRFLAPVLTRMEHLWPNAGPEQRMMFRQAALRLVLEHSADRAVAIGLMPPFPNPAPKGWGSWIWYAAETSRFMAQVRESGG
jgi:hypothetical protein